MSEIIAHHLQDREQINILDPTSGSGSLLINIGESVQKYLQDSGRRNNNGVQIIVTEHADEDVWGGIESVHLVARWRGADNKLIPSSWL
jgi:hypothetical protein